MIRILFSTRATAAAVAASLALVPCPAAAQAQAAVGSAAAAAAPLPRKRAPRPTTPAITAADLMTRLYVLADDSMMGRQAGTEYNIKGTAYIAAEAKRAGLLPAGDSGTYFQNVPLVRRTFSASSKLSVDGAPLAIWSDYAPLPGRGLARGTGTSPVVFGGVWGDSAHALTATQAAGRVVVYTITGTPPRSAPRVRAGSPLADAAAIVLVGPDQLTPAYVASVQRPTVTLVPSNAAEAARAAVPVAMVVTPAVAARMLGGPLSSAQVGAAGRTVTAALVFEETPAPARNVVAVLPGGDAGLKGEYVALGAHNDHIGFTDRPTDHDSLRAANARAWEMAGRYPGMPPLGAEQRASIRVNVDSLRKLSPARRDSIDNGADDDGSGSVALLEIGEALARARTTPRRSVLFVWHTGEELGLLGSRWFSDHPTVPRDSIVAQINIDMIGRGGAADMKGGGPYYLALVGSRRLSTELGDLVESVNRGQRHPLTLDYALDANGHPENIYCRSDHYNYARWGIPVVFLTTGLHGDYHQVTDEPQYIDYTHMARITRFVNDLTLRVANLNHRVVVDKPKPDPTGTCQQ
ncbi:MAG TPA: M28 family peptidase [Gemmatimonadaceae bacterium]|nr:M28 family peptidase [Gemmatimonadaceae bacterium]